jgi:hypothetical protein
MMQVLSVEHLSCAEALAIRRHLRTLRSKAPSSERSRTFRAWLVGHGGKYISDNDIIILAAFLQLLRWYHRLLSTMLSSSLVQVDLGTVRCSATGELLHIAAVPCGHSTSGQPLFHSLSHELGHKAQVEDSAELKWQHGTVLPRIFVTERLPLFLDAAQDFGELFACKVGDMCLLWYCA